MREYGILMLGDEMSKIDWGRVQNKVSIALSIGLAVAVLIMVFALINLTKANSSSKAFLDSINEPTTVESNR